MAFHLAHPALSTTGKSKIKKKFRTAKDAQTARQNEEDWKQLQERWKVEDEQKKKSRAMTAPGWNPGRPQYRGSDQPRIPSVTSTWDNCTKAPDKVYTGDKMLGVATMHKSNSVPVFSAEEATDIGKMRRG